MIHSDISNAWIWIKLFRCVYVYACNRIVYNKWNPVEFWANGCLKMVNQVKPEGETFSMHSKGYRTWLISWRRLENWQISSVLMQWLWMKISFVVDIVLIDEHGHNRTNRFDHISDRSNEQHLTSLSLTWKMPITWDFKYGNSRRRIGYLSVHLFIEFFCRKFDLAIKYYYKRPETYLMSDN